MGPLASEGKYMEHTAETIHALQVVMVLARFW